MKEKTGIDVRECAYHLVLTGLGKGAVVRWCGCGAVKEEECAGAPCEHFVRIESLKKEVPACHI